MPLCTKCKKHFGNDTPEYKAHIASCQGVKPEPKIESGVRALQKQVADLRVENAKLTEEIFVLKGAVPAKPEKKAPVTPEVVKEAPAKKKSAPKKKKENIEDLFDLGDK